MIIEPVVTNRINFKTFNDVEFDLQLRGNLIVVLGNSGSGKSFFAKTVNRLKLNPMVSSDMEKWLKCVNVINYENINYINLNGLIESSNGQLFIMDNADNYLNTSLVKLIANDIKNQYIIFTRLGWEFETSPNYVGEFLLNGKKIYLSYLFSESGWM